MAVFFKGEGKGSTTEEAPEELKYHKVFRALGDDWTEEPKYRKVFRALGDDWTEEPKYRKVFRALGDDDWTVKLAVMEDVEAFTCLMYGQTQDSSV